MGGFVSRFIYGETDVNANSIPDNQEIIKLLNAYLERKSEKDKLKENKKLLKKVLKQK